MIDIPGDGSLKYSVQPMGGHAGPAIDIPDALTTAERGESHIAGGPDGVVPENLHDLAEARVEAVDNARPVSYTHLVSRAGAEGLRSQQLGGQGLALELRDGD